MSKWQEKRLGEVASDVSYGYTESATFDIIGPKFLRITDITNDLINWNKVTYCKINDKDMVKYKLQYNDIVIARTGATTGINKQINKIIDAVFASYLIRFRINDRIANPKYVYHYLQTSAYKGFINNYISGSAQPGINATVLSKFKITLPDIKTQEKIADILSTYDDLIENNNRRIEILEQMAQEIYKEWFVRFRFPGHEKVKFVNGIPEGWEVKKIGDIASIKSGYAFKSSWWQEEGIPVIKIKDIQNNGIDTNNFAYVSEIHMEKAKQFIAEPGDIVIALTGATIGKIGLIPFYHKPLLINQRVGKFFCGEKPILNNGYLYILLQQNWIKDLIFMISSSSAAQPNISPNDIEEIKIFYNKNVIEQFNQKISDYILQILKLKNINQNLIKQRDLLLPRLMSGKLEV